MEQRTAEWHALRKTKIGASDASAILGMSPYKTAYDLWLEKTSPMIEQPHINPYMQRGIDLEPEALKVFEAETGYLMTPKVLISEKNDFMIASLDGYEFDGKTAVEIKCPGKKDHECAYYDGKIPEKYIPQLQHQLAVTGLDSMFYFSYTPESHKIIEVKRDDEFIANMIEKEAEFYYENMLKKLPPKSNGRFACMDSEQWKKVSEEYKSCKMAIKQLEEKQKHLASYTS